MPASADFLPAQRMAATGIGFAGIDGAWWRPALAPFPLPAAASRRLAEYARALLALSDVAGALYDTAEGRAAGLDALLTYKVPAALARLVSAGPLLSLRPDFQLVPQPAAEAAYDFAATELEVCPSAHGFAHALQVGYGLAPDLAPAFARLLAGRPLVIVGTQHWSEFLIEQLAFCRALAECGACGRVWYDRPLAALAAEFRAGQRWQPPMFGVRHKPPGWNDDLLGRLRAHDLLRFAAADEPVVGPDTVLFRFGYCECFAPDWLARFQAWEARGAVWLNPPTFYLDSKALLAAAGLPAVRARLAALDAGLVSALDRCLPETRLLQLGDEAQLLDEQADWVLKFAGFDSGQQAWGGRSLQIGAALSRAEWAAAVRNYQALPWPVVAQRHTPTARVSIAYQAAPGQPATLDEGYTRLRIFCLRGQAGAPVHGAGAHLTVSGGTAQVSEATDAVQAPVTFGEP